MHDWETRCGLGALSLDLTDKADHVRVKLPEKQDWITIYPCK